MDDKEYSKQMRDDVKSAADMIKLCMSIDDHEQYDRELDIAMTSLSFALRSIKEHRNE